MIDMLADQHRLILDVNLTPTAGSTFQPTGFPDLGAAEFQRPGEPPALIVEAVQSMTNRFEELGWDLPRQRPAWPLERLPYLEVVATDDGRFLTSSRLEPHRLAASYVVDAQTDGVRGLEWLSERLGLEKGRPIAWPQFYRGVFELDPLCLVHGVFFSRQGFHGNPKVRRALTAIVEAHDVAPVVSGGLKRDDVQFTAGERGEGRRAEEGYGFVPFGRTEYTARAIRLTAVVDLAQLRGYGLGDAETRLLTLLATWEVAALLEGPLRFRTACDLTVEQVSVRRPEGFELPAAVDLAAAIDASDVAFDTHGARTLTWPATKAA